MQALLCQKVPNGEGHDLATDVWLPDGPGPFPVLLTRTPYHRRGALGGARRYTDQGYAYVVQDCRGKYDSTGVFRPLVYEAVDGHAAIDWIANQTWCNGRVGLVGRSYLGIVQIPAASGGHEALRCIVPAVAPNSFFIDWLRYDGCFALANAIRWSMSHAVCPTQPPLDHFTWDELYALGSLDEIESRAGFAAPELREWVAHDTYDDYWEPIDQHRMYERITCAGLHVGGWFDHLTRGQFQAFRGIGQSGASEIARANQRLFIGPWGHSTIGQREYGEWDFGPEAPVDSLAYEQRFIDLWMKDIDDGISGEAPARVFLMGENRWINLPDWPPPRAETQQWHLRSNGNANGLGGDGRLSIESPNEQPPDRYTYDPQDPVPTRGGPIYWGLSPAGPVEQRPILERQDVLYYRGEILPAPLTVMGEVNLDLWITSSAEDTDFIAKLCVVEPGGRVTVLTIGSLRCRYRESWQEPKALEPGAPTRLRINMGNLAYVFPAGSRIALIVTSSSFPRILPHPNTMAPTWRETSPQVARQEVLHTSEHPSSLLLPVVPT
jgi:putative CocE/NonD family hydrolase